MTKDAADVYQQTKYESQLALKKKQVRDKLMRLGGIQEPDVKDTVGMEEPFRYRNKASMPVSTEASITKKRRRSRACTRTEDRIL